MIVVARHRRRRADWLVLFALSMLLVGMMAAPLAAQTPSGCIDISDQPPSYSGIQFAAAIQTNIFVNFLSPPSQAGCADCHTTLMGTQSPSGNLDLDPQDDPPPYDNIVNVPSDTDSTLTYVVPNHPERSLLFWKVNCTDPVAGDQMPSDGYPTGSTS